MQKTDATLEELLATVERSANYLANRVSKVCRIEFDDAKQELMIAAWQASKKYDASKAKFTTFGVWRMKRAALTMINSHMRNPITRNTVLETDLETGEFEGSLLENILVDSGTDPYYSVLDQMELELENHEVAETLDMIEGLLLRLWRATDFAYARQSHEIFRKLRYCEVQKEGKYYPITVTEVAAQMNMRVQRVSTLFAQHILPLGTAAGRQRIREQINMAEKTAKEAIMAKVEKAGKKVEKVAEKQIAGRKPKAGGLQDKVTFLEKAAVLKGKTRSEAVQMLQEKYPEMTLNYARTVVYSSMKDFEWTKAERKAPPVKAKKAEKAAEKVVDKKATKTSAKPAAKPAPAAKAPATKAKAEKPAKAKPAASEEDDDFDF